MKNKTLKRIIALILALVTLGTVSAVSYSADYLDEYYAELEKQPTTEYRLWINTAGRYGASTCTISVQLTGDKGTTDWINIGKVGNTFTQDPNLMIYTMFEAKNVGRVSEINLKVNGSDDWYVNQIQINYNGIEQHFYGGRWVREGNIVTLKESDNVYRIELQTSSSKNSGTDQDVTVTLKSKDGKTTVSQNLTKIHPANNAFERGDCVEFYVYLDADELGEVEIRLGDSWLYMAAASWKLEKITIEQMNTGGEGVYYEDTRNEWIKMGSGFSVKF